jgi:hypothetical protein
VSQSLQSAVLSWSSQTGDLEGGSTERMRAVKRATKGGRAAYRAHVPTNTAHTPPYPPATKDLTFSAAADAAETGACSDMSPLCGDIEEEFWRKGIERPTIFA